MKIRIFGFELAMNRKQLQSLSSIGNDGWFPIIREPYAGAWQRNHHHIQQENILGNSTLYRCVTLIATDVAKMDLVLMREESGIETEFSSPAFSGILEQPNHYQNSIQFIEHWLVSKLTAGNTYVLKGRDGRNVVNELYVLDPHRVTPLVAPDRQIFYQLNQDNLSGIPLNVTVPASEIIHDRMNALWHPLVGISPVYCAGLPASQALRIIKYSDRFFSNAARPSGVLTAPGIINKDTAERLKSHWEQNYTGENSGKVAILGDGLHFEGMQQNAVDSELIAQLKLTDEKVATAFGVPGYKLGIAPAPAYNNIEALNQEYYNSCLQTHIESIERLMESGLELPSNYTIEFDLDGLLRMDTATKITSLKDAVGSGILKPNEARASLGYGPVKGGDTPYLQQQNFSLTALDRRDSSNDPFALAPKRDQNTPTPAQQTAAEAAANASPPAKDLPDLTAQAISAMQKELANV